MSINTPEQYLRLLPLLHWKGGKQTQDQGSTSLEFFLLALAGFPKALAVGLK